MRDEIVLHGIVVATSLVNDYDKRLVILTKERGKITAFAKGARRATNQLISKSQIFVMGEFCLYESRNAYTVKNIDVKEYFLELTFDMDKYCYGSYFCEIMAFFTSEGERAASYLNLLFVSLNALKKGVLDARLIKCIFEIKIMDMHGQGMQSCACPVCGSLELTNVFDALLGGVICVQCQKKSTHPIAISDSTKYTLDYVNSAELGKLYNFTVTDEVLLELEKICKIFLFTYVDKKFNSECIIDSMKKNKLEKNYD